MRILALDPSLTRTGYVLDSGKCGVLVPPKGQDRGEARLVWIRDRIVSMARLDRTDLVVIEGYSYDSKHQTHQLGELGGVIRVGLYEAGIPFIEISPASWKQFATDNGGAGKPLTLSAAVSVLGYRGGDFNEADALWLWAMAKYAFGGIDLDLPLVQLRKVEAIAWPGRDNQPHLAPKPKSKRTKADRVAAARDEVFRPRRPVATASAADDLFGDGRR